MKLFKFNRNKKSKKNTNESNENKPGNGYSLSSVNREQKDLTNPLIDDHHKSGVNYVFFGEQNLYPNILNDLYASSPMNNQCIDFKTWSIVGEQYRLINYDNLKTSKKIDFKYFKNQSNFEFAIKKLTKDWIKHGRSIALLHYNKEEKKYDYFKAVDPANIRNNKANVFSEPTDYYYSDNWQYRSNPMHFSRYEIGNTDEWQVLEIKNFIDNYTYGKPSYIGGINWISVSSDLALLHKSSLENGIQPSIMFKYPYIMEPDEETNFLKNIRNNYKGVKNYNRAMKIEARGKEQMPEIDVLKTSDNHKIFEGTTKEEKEQIAMSHNINPALMGVRIPGSLGQSEETPISARQFEKIWLNDNRNTMNMFINEILLVCGFDLDFKFNETEIISITGQPNDTELRSNKSPNGARNNESNDNNIVVNDNMKGLTAKENSDLYRIVRDYHRGKLNHAIAITRLMSYGIEKENANEILKEEQKQ